MLNPALETRLRELVDILLTTNQQFNLTAIKDPDLAWSRHILDSLEGLQTGLFEGEISSVDVGSGAGFPGLPLALARPHLRPAFVEATGKKCRYIEATAQHFGLKALALNMRAEVAGHDARYRAHFDVATARAVGSFMEVAEYCLPLVKVNGHVVLWRGRDAVEECRASEEALDILGGALQDVRAYALPGVEGEFHLVTIAKLAPTSRKYPRSVGLPKTRPLTGDE